MPPASHASSLPLEGRLFPLGLSRRSQVQGGMNHSGAGWRPGGWQDGPVQGTGSCCLGLGSGPSCGCSGSGGFSTEGRSEDGAPDLSMCLSVSCECSSPKPHTEGEPPTPPSRLLPHYGHKSTQAHAAPPSFSQVPSEQPWKPPFPGGEEGGPQREGDLVEVTQ